MFGSRAAAAAHDVDEVLVDKGRDTLVHGMRRLVVVAHNVGEAGIGVSTYETGDEVRELSQERQHLFCAERAVEAYGEHVGMRDGSDESLQSLARQRASRSVGNGDGEHYGQCLSGMLESETCRLQSRLCVKGVEDSLY